MCVLFGTELNFSLFPDDAVDVSGFGGEDSDVLLNAVSQVDTVPHHRLRAQLIDTDVPMMSDDGDQST
jgi:hypothetical protein